MDILGVPNLIFDDFQTISGNEIKFFLGLLYLSHRRSPLQISQSELQTFIGISHITIKSACRNLISKDLLRIQKQPTQHSATIYLPLGAAKEVALIEKPQTYDLDQAQVDQIKQKFQNAVFHAWTSSFDGNPASFLEHFSKNIWIPAVENLSGLEIEHLYGRFLKTKELPDFVKIAPIPAGHRQRY